MPTNDILTKKLVPVLLAGGIGSRLWPLSREHHPKQLLSLLGDDSLLQATLRRILRFPDIKQFLIICNEEQRYQILMQVEQLAPNCDFKIILEPEGCNTAPAVVAAFYLAADVNMLLMPADHILQPEHEFLQQLSAANEIASIGRLITFGIQPTYAEPGYGYIEVGEKLHDGAYAVKQFVEKPDKHTAEIFLQQGNHYWNSGMFLFPCELFLSELEQVATDIYSPVHKATEKFIADDHFIRFNTALFAQVPNKSLDYALMEHTQKAEMLPLNLQWSDIGSWQSLYEYETKDEYNNVLRGDVLSLKNQDCYLYSDSHLLAAIGLTDIIAVQTADCVLIANKNSSQKVKEVVSRLQIDKRREAEQHLTQYHPWGGTSTLINQGTGFRINRVNIQPGKQLSLHEHDERSEH